MSETLLESYTTDDDLSTAPFESPAGLLSGLHWFADTYLASNSNIIHGFDPAHREMYIEIPSGVLASQYLNLTDFVTIKSVLGCQFEWVSPMKYITNALNSVAFNAALIAGLEGNESDFQKFTALQTQPMVVYHSEHGYLAIALILLLSALFTVSTTIYGFWQIDHDMSLSPLETGHAFGAPVLAEGVIGGSGGNMKELMRAVGKKEVKYGVLSWSSVDGIWIEKKGIGAPQCYSGT